LTVVANVAKRPDGVWRARYRDETGREYSKHFARKADADKWVTEQMASVLRGAHVDPTDKTTVTEYARAWAAARPHRASTARRCKSLIDKHIAGTALGARRMASVRPSEVQAWVSGRAQVLSPATLRMLVSLLRSIYNSAVLDRVVSSSPVVRVSIPTSARERVIPLTVDQVRKLAAAMPARNKAMVITQAGLGLRVAELMALRVQDVDFLRRTVRIETQMVVGGKGARGPLKTPRSKRTLPLPQVVGEALAAHMQAFPPGEDGSLFTTPTGRPYGHTHYGWDIFTAAAKKAGFEGTSSHDLRHHYASVLLAAGESVVAVAERLGHENANLVLTTYGHLMPDSEHRTRKAIDEAWSEATTSVKEVS
jgi:integrase